jgi:hypothetical protein
MFLAVIPAKAGIQDSLFLETWIPDYYLGNDDKLVLSSQSGMDFKSFV